MCRCSPSQFSLRCGRFHWAAIQTRKRVSRCFAALRQLHHLHHYVLTDDCFHRLVVSFLPLATRLGKLHIVYQPVFSDNSSLCSTLQLVWCSGFDATTTSLTPLQHSTGCVTTTGRLQNCGHGVSSAKRSVYSSPYLDQLVRVADLPGRHRVRSSSSHRL